MKAVTKFLAGAAAVAVASVGFAAPAAAQYYPPYGGYNNGGLGNVIVGAVLDSILRGGYGGYSGYGGYGYHYVNERTAVDQCARATEARLNGYAGGYGGGYGGYNAPIRVVQIDRLERTRNGNFRVYGQAGDAGYRGNYGGYGGYNNPYGGGYYGNATAPQYRFSCKVDRRTGRVSDIDIDRNRYAGYRY